MNHQFVENLNKTVVLKLWSGPTRRVVSLFQVGHLTANTSITEKTGTRDTGQGDEYMVLFLMPKFYMGFFPF